MLTHMLILGFCLCAFATYGFGQRFVAALQQEAVPSLNEILDGMKAHDEWQRLYLIEFRAQRKFSATNPKFKQGATLELRTTFRRPDTLESNVIRAEGSKMIRERVFDKILEA